jgi:hypothetical protein
MLPNSPQCLFALAVSTSDLLDFHESKELLEKLLKLIPSNTIVQRELEPIEYQPIQIQGVWSNI